MPDLFFAFPACAGVNSPPAMDPSPVLADCGVPDPPEPVYSCPPPEIPLPTTYDETVLHIRITGRDDDRHDWEGVESDGDGGWYATGRTGSSDVDSGSEAYEQQGVPTDPSAKVYLARRVPGTGKLVFLNGGGGSDSRAAVATTAITARSGTTPGSGSVQPLRKSGGVLVNDGGVVTVGNLGAAIASGKTCMYWIDAAGDKWAEPEDC